MGVIDVYEPKMKKQKFVGGSFGEVYRNVIKKAKKYLKSPEGKNLKKGIKRKVLEIGSGAIQNILSGKNPLRSMKSAKKKIKNQLSPVQLNNFKNSVLKKGGITTLYRLKGRNKKGKKNISLDTLYRLNSLKSKRRRKKGKKRKKKSRRKRVKRKKVSGKKRKKKRKKIVKRKKKGGSRMRTVFDI